MDQRIYDLAELTKAKYGLTAYRLHKWHIFRGTTLFRGTVYRLSMEWFPIHVGPGGNEDTNPAGTVCMEIDIASGKLENMIFVGGVTYADSLKFDSRHKDEIIRWIEKETGLVYGKQFELWKEKERKLQFRGCVDGIAVSPAASIEIQWDEEGRLVFFSVTGPFPPHDRVKRETYALSLDQAEKWAALQLKSAEFPDMDRKRFVAAYAIEEIYIRNDNASTLPFSYMACEHPRVRMDTVITWDAPLPEPFRPKNISLVDHATPEQAFRREAHPDLAPISEEDIRRYVRSAQTFLRQVFADDSGKWTLTTLHREKGYIWAELQANERQAQWRTRKLRLIIDPPTGEVLNYLDNEPLLAVYADFQEAEEGRVPAEEAFAKLKRHLTLTPYYVYDHEQGSYVLCGKLDCDYAVKADTGEVIPITGNRARSPDV